MELYLSAFVVVIVAWNGLNPNFSTHLKSHTESSPGIFHYYITCQLPHSVRSLLWHVEISVCMQPRQCCSCVGCFEDATLTMLQIVTESPSNIVVFLRAEYALLEIAKSWGEKREEKRGEEKMNL